MRRFRGESLRYSPLQGYQPLRAYLAHRLKTHGISATEDDILITNGARQAIDLVARLLCRDEKVIALESPTYPAVIPLLEFNSGRLAPIPMRDDGIDLDVLEQRLESEDVSFVYTMPTFQNPTGISTDGQHRERLLALCQHNRVPIIEDGYAEDLKYFYPVAHPIKSIDKHQIVIYIGTFSKSLFPGMRIGWVVADQACIQRLLAIKRFADLTTNTLAQMALYKFCSAGFYTKHLRRLHRIFRKRLTTALRGMNEVIPPTVKWTSPVGGFTVWICLPSDVIQHVLDTSLKQHGLIISPGRFYYPEGSGPISFRISIAQLSEAEIKEGISRLGRVLREVC
jgi:DNA-binding transcriptional MocR family regulator